jgi:peptidyl-tRNA hydrolase, PTH1 family
MSAIKLIVGLGNPGAEYARTRHNAGFWFLDALAAQAGVTLRPESKLHGELAKASVDGRPLWLLKPDTYMNRSAQAVVATLRFYRIAPEEMLVAHDELDLAPGTVRLKFDGGHGGQNGLRDILAQLGHGRFHRLRVGIGHPGNKDQVTPWVLGRPNAEHEAAMRDSIGRAVEVVPLLVNGNHNEAMKKLHTADRSRMAG